jgi:hypothetical protein
MDKKTKNKLKDLISRVIALDSREILIKQDKHNPIKSKFTERYATTPKELKIKIQQIFAEYPQTFPSPESLRSYAKKYLTQQERLTDPRVNPSFKLLRQRLETGQYDILTSLGLTTHYEKQPTQHI